MNSEELNKSIEQMDNKDELTIRKKTRDKTPPYSIIGNGKSTKEFKEDVVIDTIDLISKMNPQQVEIFIYFRNLLLEEQLYYYSKNSINDKPNNIIISRSKNDQNALHIKELLRRNNNGKKLIELKAIKKIKAGEYMVNPYMIIPPDNFLKAVEKWNSIEV